MNRPAAVAWWARPFELDDEPVDAEHPCIPLPREREARALSEPIRARLARVLRSDMTSVVSKT